MISNHLQKKLRHKKQQYFLYFWMFGVFFFALILIAYLWFFHVKVHMLHFEKNKNHIFATHVDKGTGLLIGHTLYRIGFVQISVASHGYKPQNIRIDDISPYKISVALTPILPRVSLKSVPSLAQAMWYVNDTYMATGDEAIFTLAKGKHQIYVTHPFYETQKRTISLSYGDHREEVFSLKKITQPFTFHTQPQGATITIHTNGEKKDYVSPATIMLKGGQHDITIRHVNFHDIHEKITVSHNHTIHMRHYTLTKKDAFVTFDLMPKDGTLLIDGTAVSLVEKSALKADTKHTILYQKPGYAQQQKSVTLRPGQTKHIAFSLEKQYGSYSFTSSPSAHVYHKDVLLGTTPFSTYIETLPIEVVFQQENYQKSAHIIKADALFKKKLHVSLLAIGQKAPSPTHENPISAQMGIKFSSITPHSYTMGSPANEKGRKRNERQRNIDLDKKFFVSKFEITNAQYAMFRPMHKLRNPLPVVNITWNEAALFCNWLSQKEGLEAFYHFDGETYTGYTQNANGYRLLSEAEWEFIASKAGYHKKQKFPWGNRERIPKKAGNLADESAKNILPSILKNYHDGYEMLAPVGSHPPNHVDVYDLVGNVSEWVHDYYTFRLPLKNTREKNPFGSQKGQNHVIKGSHWASHSLTELRASYREAGPYKSDKIGFRIAKWHE